MERALFLQSGPAGRSLLDAVADLPRVLGGGGFDRLYAGHETCEHGIPTARVLERVREACVEARVPLTLVLPTLSDQGLARAWAAMGAVEPGTEVVFNDWGLLAGVRERGLVPVLGRLLTGAPRDPRIRASDHSEASLAWLRTSSVHSPGFQAILREEGVVRVELDALRQGIEPLPEGSLPASLLTPLVHVTTSRYCAGEWSVTCGRMRCPSTGSRVGGAPVLLWGVATFYPTDGLPGDAGALGFDRVVRTLGPDGLGALEGRAGAAGGPEDDLLRDVLDADVRAAIEVLGVRLLAVSLPSKDPTVTLVLERSGARFRLQLHVPGSGKPHYRATERFLAGYGGDGVDPGLVDALVEILVQLGVDPALLREKAGLDDGRL